LKVRIEELESDAEHTKTQMVELFKCVCRDIKNNPAGKFSADELFSVAARACSIVGVSVDEQKEIEISV